MRALCAFLLSSVALLLSACAGMPVLTTSNTDSVPGTVLRGSVHGGQNPITGAHVYLYAVNNTGYGGPGIAPSSTNLSVSLLRSASNTTKDGSGNYYVTTDQYGNFIINSDYTCPSNYAHTYFYASGGDPGLGSGVNSAITLTAPADACNTSASTDINEVSTIVTAYVFAGYASDPLHVSSSNTTLAATGLANAANTLSNLEDISKSVAVATTPGLNGTVPQQEINTLANILAACVNSTGPASTQCSTLFSNATNNGVNAPDTATAALNIAHNPGPGPTVIANLFGLQTPSSPFQTQLSAAPNDFTIAISYTGGGLNSPVPLVIDAAGDVWVGNTATGANSVSEFSPVGAPITTSAGDSGGGIVDPYSIAIDKSGNVWTANITPNSLSEISNTGTPATLSPYTGGGLNAPYDIAFDSLGHVWVVNNVGSSLSEFSAAGSPITTAPGDQGGGINNDPVSLAIDASGNIWVSDSITLGALSEFYSSGASAGMPISASTGDTGGGLDDPWGIAVDANGNIWAADSGSGANRISLFGAGGSAISSSNGYTGGGLNIPEGIAIDGAGNVWVVNRGSTDISPPYPPSSISEFNSSGVPVSPTGYQAGLNISLRIAVDGSGNVWVTNASLNTVTEFVGAGSPVVTPIVANLLFPYGARAVNKP
jgi:streptogramin lyase